MGVSHYPFTVPSVHCQLGKRLRRNNKETLLLIDLVLNFRSIIPSHPCSFSSPPSALLMPCFSGNKGAVHLPLIRLLSHVYLAGPGLP